MNCWSGKNAPKIFLSGPTVRDANQLPQLCEVFCTRKKTLYEMSKLRLSMEENQKLVPLVERLARKSPEDEKIITNEWKLKCVEFYETKSEIVKGHHSMYKVGPILLLFDLAFARLKLCRRELKEILGRAI